MPVNKLIGALLSGDAQQCSNRLRKGAEKGWLLDLIPEIRPMIGCAQNRHHQEGCVWEHTLRVVANAEPGYGLGSELDLLTLRMAALLHDVGKPSTATPWEGRPGEYRFVGHERVGAEMAGNIVGSLWLDSDGEFFKADTGSAIVWLVANHMRAHKLHEMSRKKVAQLMRRGKLSDQLLCLLRADALGRLPLPDDWEKPFINGHCFLQSDVRLVDLGIDVDVVRKLENPPSIWRHKRHFAKLEIMENLLTKNRFLTRKDLLAAVGLVEEGRCRDCGVHLPSDSEYVRDSYRDDGCRCVDCFLGVGDK